MTEEVFNPKSKNVYELSGTNLGNKNTYGDHFETNFNILNGLIKRVRCLLLAGCYYIDRIWGYNIEIKIKTEIIKQQNQIKIINCIKLKSYLINEIKHKNTIILITVSTIIKK